MNAKIFNLDEANKMLPLVRTIVRDVVATWGERESLKRRIRRETRRTPRLGPEGRRSIERINELNVELDAVEFRMERYKKELFELGCAIKDCEHGAVVFPAFVGDELVYLGWLFGENEIRHFHSIREPYTKRRRLPASLMT